MRKIGIAIAILFVLIIAMAGLGIGSLFFCVALYRSSLVPRFLAVCFPNCSYCLLSVCVISRMRGFVPVPWCFNAR